MITSCVENTREAGQRAFTVGEAALADLRRLGIPPTPHNYELWFAHRQGDNPGLSARVDGLLSAKMTLGAADLDELRSEFLAVANGAETLHEVAENLIDHLSQGHAGMRDYGEILDRGRHGLADAKSIATIVELLNTLTAETLRASQRNRVLEQQLSISTQRIAKLRQSLADTRQEATTDPLTGIANRRAFDASLRRAMAQARADRRMNFSVLLIDIDHFKDFNDTHGHRMGDLVLRLIARILTENVKGRDLVARHGGEEFAILLTGAEQAAAASVARQLGQVIASKHLVGKNSGRDVGQITISTGVAQARSTDSPSSLIERADAALYDAKRAGRNRVCPAEVL